MSGDVSARRLGFKYGYMIAKYPIIGLIVLLVLGGAFVPGLLKLEITNDQNDLWVNKESDLWKEKSLVDEKFGRFFRAEQVIFRPKDDNMDDMIRKDYLQEMFWFQEIAMRTNITRNGKVYNVSDLCWSALPNAQCTVQTPLGFWQNNYTRLMEDTDIHYTTQCLNSIDPKNSLACMDDTGLPVQLEVVFGGLAKIYNTSVGCSAVKGALGAPVDACTPYIWNAKALVLTILLNDLDATNPVSEEWEQKAIMDTGAMWSNNDDTKFLQKLLPHLKIPDRKLQLKLNYMVGRSIPDELKAEGVQNSFVVVVSYAMMLIYVTFSLGNIPSKHGKPTFLIGIFGILMVAVSALVGYGATSYLGVKSSMISLEVIPFLILAIGVDNMFIISQAVQRETHASNNVRIGLAIQECIPSMAVACITEVVTFAVGITTNIPALKVFCMTAVFSILANFILQMTSFVAVLSWDMKRIKAEPANIDDYDQAKAGKGLIGNCFSRLFTPFVQNRVVNIIVLVTAVVLTGLSVPAFKQLELGLDQQISVRTDGVLYNYFNDLSTYFNSGPQAYIIMQNFIPNKNTTEFMTNLTDLLTQKGDLITPPIQNWLSDFDRFMNNLDGKCLPSDPFNTTQGMIDFMNIDMKSYCCLRNGICGAQYYQHIILPKTNDTLPVVNFSRVMFLHSPVRTQKDFIRNYDETHQIIDALNANLSAMVATDPDYENRTTPTMFAHSMFYIYFEQYTYIKGVAVQNLAVSLLLLFGIVSAVFSIAIAIHVTVIISCTITSMVTLIYITNLIFGGWGIMINAISVVNLVTAIGFAVEFSVHILLKYSRAVGKKQQRIKIAMNTMGTSVFSGIFCTKLLGISILAFAPSALFRIYYFRMYILMILLCGFYGLMFLPAYLSLVGSDKLPSARSGKNPALGDSQISEAGSLKYNSLLSPHAK